MTDQSLCFIFELMCFEVTVNTSDLWKWACVLQNLLYFMVNILNTASAYWTATWPFNSYYMLKNAAKN